MPLLLVSRRFIVDDYVLNTIANKDINQVVQKDLVAIGKTEMTIVIFLGGKKQI